MDTTNLKTFVSTFYPANSAYYLYERGLINSIELSNRLDLIITTLFFAHIINETEYHTLNSEQREITDRLPYEVTNV